MPASMPCQRAFAEELFTAYSLLGRYPRTKRPEEKVRFAPAGVPLVSRERKKPAAIAQFALPARVFAFLTRRRKIRVPFSFVNRIGPYVRGKCRREVFVREVFQRSNRTPTPNVKSLFHIQSCSS